MNWSSEATGFVVMVVWVWFWSWFTDYLWSHFGEYIVWLSLEWSNGRD